MPRTANMTSDEHLTEACNLLDQAKERAAQDRVPVATMYAALAQTHATIAAALIAKHRRG